MDLDGVCGSSLQTPGKFGQFQPHQELMPDRVLHHFFKRLGIYLTRIEETTRLPRSRETP
jgi:hypothetical protein